ncbi:MAG: TIGR03000 domain-containing protein [Gemmataceae bacterium]|nr:TIGR03000 domain-containing protein [Gemmataceae bacterium]
MTKTAPKFDPAVRPASATAPAKKLGPKNGVSKNLANKNLAPNKNLGPSKTFGPNKGGNVAKGGAKGGKGNVAGKANHKGDNGNWNNHHRYHYNHNRWHGGHYGYHHDHHHDHSFWPFFAYAAISDWLWYRPFGSNYWGYYPYAGRYWEPEIIYVDESAPAVAAALDATATIDVRLPNPDAEIWIDGAETESRGTERRYWSPTLRAGSNYSYTITAAWSDDGEVRTIERQIPLQAGSRVLLDFTQSPSRVTITPARDE